MLVRDSPHPAAIVVMKRNFRHSSREISALARASTPAAEKMAALTAAGVRVVNLMSSPGAGKTTLLRETLLRLRGTVRIGIVEGDIETG